jgi:DNA-binding response OmpR family regulator
LKCLVVDDDVAICDLLRSKLTNAGHDVIVANNGADGIAFARSEKPDLVLLDVMMPGVDGLQACAQLRADSVTADMPILIVSSGKGRDEIQRGIDAGANDYITKPFSPREVVRRVQQFGKPAA